MTSNDGLLTLLNKSGFPFQRRIASEIQINSKRWTVLPGEHPWMDKESGKGGHIDIVLSAGQYRPVLECKKVNEGDWIFLVPEEAVSINTSVRCAWIHHVPEIEDIGGWWDAYSKPASFESDTCIMQGQDEKAPILERLASLLCITCDAFCQDLSKFEHPDASGPWIVVPIVVTNANLYLSKLKSTDVSLVTARTGEAAFEIIPYIRFRKPLTTRIAGQNKIYTLAEANHNRERTVFVVNSQHLIAFLDQFSPEKGQFDRYPWEVMRTKIDKGTPSPY